jgi:hypothetical protein
LKDKKSGEDFEVRGGTVGSGHDRLAAGFCQQKKENRCCGNAREDATRVSPSPEAGFMRVCQFCELRGNTVKSFTLKPMLPGTGA